MVIQPQQDVELELEGKESTESEGMNIYFTFGVLSSNSWENPASGNIYKKWLSPDTREWQKLGETPGKGNDPGYTSHH